MRGKDVLTEIWGGASLKQSSDAEKTAVFREEQVMTAVKVEELR